MAHPATSNDASASTARARRSYSQACPVAHSLDLLGERWTLLIVRDLMFGPMRFSDLRDGLAGIAPNLLSSRLSMLCERGIIESVEHISPGSRSAYRLTTRGRELAPVVHALARFGVDEWTDPDADPPPLRLLRGALLALMEPEVLDDSQWRATVVLRTHRLSSDNSGDRGALATDTRAGNTETGSPNRRYPESRSVEISVRPATEGLHPLNRLRLTTGGDGSEPPVLLTTLGTLWDLRRGRCGVSDLDADKFSYRGSSTVYQQMRTLFGWNQGGSL